VACPDLILMWHMCMSREFPLVGHTNISIEDYVFHNKIYGQELYTVRASQTTSLKLILNSPILATR
jgi:hypothetical protein